MMDVKEDWKKEVKGDFAEFLLETKMEDVHKMRQQETPKTTYTRGSKRLDYIFMSPNLMSTVRRAGYLPIHDGVISDHRMCYVECNLLAFLGVNVNKISRPHQRSFKCDDKERCKVLITELKKNIKDNKTKERILRIINEFREEGKSDDLISQYNKMDYELQCSIK